MDEFYTFNMPKTIKKNTTESRENVARRLSNNLKKCLENNVVCFYKLMLDEIESLFNIKYQANAAVLPSLFIQGCCVSWNAILKQVEHRWREFYRFFYVTPGDTSLKLLSEIKASLKDDECLVVVIPKVECFLRNSFIDSVIEFLVNSSIRCYLIMNSVIDYTTILDRVSRVNYTYLDVRSLELTPPDQLLNDVFDVLLDGSALCDATLQFSGDLLLQARSRYLYEDFSLSQLRKHLMFALVNYVITCTDSTLKALVNRKNAENFSNRKIYVEVLNCLVLLQCAKDDDLVEEFLKLHAKVQKDSNFTNSFLREMKSQFAEWSRDRWTDHLREINRRLQRCPETAEIRIKTLELCELLSKKKAEEESTESNELHAGGRTPKKQSAASYLKDRSKILQKARNLPSNAEMADINEFISQLIQKYLVKTEDHFLVEIPKEKLTYLETSNIKHLDEVMNPHVEVNTHSQLDFITLYHALVESSSEAISVDIMDVFNKFKACLNNENVSLSESGSSTTLQLRFFNSLAQLEYSGMASMSISEKMVRLMYLPTPTAELSLAP